MKQTSSRRASGVPLIAAILLLGSAGATVAQPRERYVFVSLSAQCNYTALSRDLVGRIWFNDRVEGLNGQLYTRLAPGTYRIKVSLTRSPEAVIQQVVVHTLARTRTWSRDESGSVQIPLDSPDDPRLEVVMDFCPPRGPARNVKVNLLAVKSCSAADREVQPVEGVEINTGWGSEPTRTVDLHSAGFETELPVGTLRMTAFYGDATLVHVRRTGVDAPYVPDATGSVSIPLDRPNERLVFRLATCGADGLPHVRATVTNMSQSPTPAIYVERSNSRGFAFIGMKLRDGDLVTVRGTGQLDWLPGPSNVFAGTVSFEDPARETVFAIGPYRPDDVPPPGGSMFSLIRGIIKFFLRAPFSEPKPYRFAASTGTIFTRVKGTTFSVAYDETTQSSTVTVEEGEVEITPKNLSLQAFALRPGQQVQVSWNNVGAVAPYAVARGGERRGRTPAAGSPAVGFGPREDNTTFQGATTLRYFPMQDAFPDRCRDACAAEAACVAYTYVNPGAFRAGDPPVCYLSSAIGQRVSSACCVSGVKSAGGLGPDVDGSTLRDAKLITYYTSPSAAACRADCERDPGRCTGFSWVKPGAFQPGGAPMCYLVSSYAERVASPCCVSGVRKGPPRAGVPAPAPPPPAPAAQPGVDLRGVWTGPVRCNSGTYNFTITIGSLGADGTFSGTANDDSPFTMRATGDQVNITRPSWGQTWTGRLTRTATGLSIDGTTSNGCTFTLTKP